MRRAWVALFAAPIAAYLDQVVSYALAPAAYRAGVRWPLWITAAIALAITVASTVLAAQEVPRAETKREKLIADGALALSVLAILTVIAMAVPVIGLQPGAEP